MEKNCKRLLDGLNDVIVLLDRDMKTLFINRGIEELSNGKIKRKNTIGKNFFDIFPFLKENLLPFDKK